MPSLTASPDQPPQRRLADDMARLVNGSAQYVADRIGPAHRHARVVRSHVAHGRIVSVDIEQARSMPGVLAVLTAQDFDGSPPRIPTRRPDPATDPYLQPVIADGMVRYVGEPVALVVADDPYRAEDAAEAVLVDIEPLEANVSVDDARARPDPRNESGAYAHLEGASGDWDAVVASADHVVTGTYRTQRQTGLPLETRGVIAEWDEDGQLHVWGPTKFVYFTRDTLASLLGLENDQVIVHAVDVGGMFGVRGEFYPEDFLVPWAARHIGAPVAWREDRREHLLATNHSRQQTHAYELALDADGTFRGYRDVVEVDAGAYLRPAGTRPAMMLAEVIAGPYHWPVTSTSVTLLPTNKTPIGSMRGPMATESSFVRERAIDRAAAVLGMDPIELRRKNLITRAQMPYHVDLGGSLHGPNLDEQDYGQVLDRALEAIDLEGTRAAIDRRRADGELVGLGIGAFLEHTGNGLSETVALELTLDGRLELKTGETEVGQGLTAMMIALAHDQLGMSTARLEVLSGDSRAHDEGRGTMGSRTAIFVGNALANGLDDVEAAARERAAELLGVEPDAITVEAEGLRAGDEAIDWKEVAPIEVRARFDMDEPTWGFGVHVAVTSVDPATGGIRLERLLAAYDCGRLLAPQPAIEQLRGGTAYGVGGALFESLPYQDDGQPLATTLAEYLLPAYSELPDIEALALTDQPAVGNPLGIRGVGEAGVLGVGGAIANAVADAIGPEAADGLLSLPVRLDDVELPSATAKSPLARLRPTPVAASIAAGIAAGIAALAAIIGFRRRRR